MNHPAFSKIWIFVALIIFIIGGIFIWQFQQPAEEKFQQPAEEKPENPILIDDFSLVINSVKTVSKWVVKEDEIPESAYYVFEPRKGQKLILVSFTVQNNGNKEDTLIVSWQYLRVVKGDNYEDIAPLTPAIIIALTGEKATQKEIEDYYCRSDKLSMQNNLLPGEANTGCMGFQIPLDYEPAKLLLYKYATSKEPFIAVDIK